jgi:predicted transcriptional regulator
MGAVKQEVRRIAEELPEDATWDDVMERVYVIQAIEAGLKASAEGRHRPVAEVRKSFGLPE